ncbi:MAG TPA: hypothetical protein VKK31_30830 [Thermoanaerobaculia bacterium]|nr:hypothetical protein [Thermoanaerobaculia bacterium]
MKAKAVRLMLLAAVLTVALWTPAVSLAFVACPSQHCSFWREVCENNAGHFTQSSTVSCELPSGAITPLYLGTCTYDWRGPWTIDCYGI